MSFPSIVLLNSVQSGTDEISGGIGIAVVGMLTVFIGLVVLAFLLPVLERWVENGFRLRKKADPSGSDNGKRVIPRLTKEGIAAISTAIHVHFLLLDQIENMKLTWEIHEKPYSPWKLAGRAEHIQETGSLQNRSRSC